MGKKGLHSITLFEVLLVVGVCVGLGVFLIRPMRIARQTAVVKPMTDAGARTGLRGDRSVYRLDATQMPVDEIHIDQITALQELLYLNLDHSDIVDADLKPIAESLELRELLLVGTGLTDKGAQHLAKMTALQVLDVRATFLSDDGLKALAPLKELQVLRLGQSWITDASMPVIAKFPNLRVLDLRHTEITDAGLLKLADMKRLEDVRLSGSSVSKSAVEALRARRPRLKIEFSDERVMNYIVLLRPRLGSNGYKKDELSPLAERAVVKRLKQLGARFGIQMGFVTSVNCSNPEFNDHDLQQLRWCRKLTSLMLKNPSITSGGWAMIHRNRLLATVYLQGVTLDSQSGEYLSNVRNLNWFTSDGMTDEALGELHSGTKGLILNGSPLTDTGLNSISREQFPRLQLIRCGNTAITDEAALAVTQKFTNKLHIETPRLIRAAAEKQKLAREKWLRDRKLKQEKAKRDRLELQRMTREAEEQRAKEKRAEEEQAKDGSAKNANE